MTTRFAIILILFVCSTQVMAQETAPDSLTVVPGDSLSGVGPDTVLLKSYATRYNPRKALLYAGVTRSEFYNE